MQHIFKVLFILLLFSSETFAFSKTTGEMYRDVIRLENQGKLPDYIKEVRSIPLPAEQQPSLADFPRKTHMQEVAEFNRNVSIDESRLPVPEANKQWPDVVKSVASGHPGIFDVEFVKKRADNSFPDAVELLAWMYTKGVGVKKNLKSAWFLYMKAADLGVENAISNAELIYKSMSLADRKKLLEY